MIIDKRTSNRQTELVYVWCSISTPRCSNCFIYFFIYLFVCLLFPIFLQLIFFPFFFYSTTNIAITEAENSHLCRIEPAAYIFQTTKCPQVSELKINPRNRSINEDCFVHSKLCFRSSFCFFETSRFENSTVDSTLL